MFDLLDLPHQETLDSEYLVQTENIRQRYAALSETEKNKRARDLAALLGVSEAQWVAASVGPLTSVRLRAGPQELLKEVGALGSVMALTRNAHCVHERHGQYLDVQTQGPVGLVLGPDIDLRMFLGCWADVFAVEESGRWSLQFFDQAGVAIHKIYCTEQTDAEHFLALVQRHAQTPAWPSIRPMANEKKPDQVVNIAAFREAWMTMTDTHQFFGLLQRFNVSRQGALQAAGSGLAQQVEPAAIERMLRHAASTELAIMCFVGNRGMIQIHTGRVRQIEQRGPWLNVLDSTFNLHLNMAGVSQVWVVNKPTEDGWVTSLEVLDDEGELIVQFFGSRKPGQPEQPPWRALMMSLCDQPLMG